MLNSFSGRIQQGFYFRYGKRAIDLTVSSIMLVFCLPLLLVIAVAVKLESTGSIIYAQERVGLNGRIFQIYKFRSMYAEQSEPALSPNSGDDPRITKVGRIIRRLSIDELPQLFNVWKGEMSLVGPRPEMLFIARNYQPRQARRLRVAPGITGLWQISQARTEAIHHNLQYDFLYIRNLCFCLDLRIMLKTFLVMLRARNTF